MTVKNKIKQLECCGWKLSDVARFNDNRKSVNYIFTSGDEWRVVMYTENNVIKKIDVVYLGIEQLPF